jgi:putative FmdB family regulatory protein
MPTYEYACKECGEHLEVVQSFKDDPLTECPACHGELRKVFSPIGIAFKGQGFYKTDSRSGASSTAAGSTDNASSSDSGSSKSSDSKSSDTKSSDTKTTSTTGDSSSTTKSTSTSEAKSA